MRVLMISGDKNLMREGTSAHERFLLQKRAVDTLELVVWPSQFFKPFFVHRKFDIVTSQDLFWRGLVAWLAAKRLGARLNVQVHADLNAQSAVKRAIAKLVLRQADSVRAVSQKVKAQVAGFTSAPVSVLPIFIDLKKFGGLEHVPHPKFKQTVLWAGRFENEKDPLLALAVFKDIRAQGVDAGLVMLGEGSLGPVLMAEVKKMGLEEYIEFPGWQDPLPFLQQADVVLCTSRAESFGAFIIEALASGTAVASLDVGIAREAGAEIADRESLANKAAEILRARHRGRFAFPILDAGEWAAAWRQTLQ